MKLKSFIFYTSIELRKILTYRWEFWFNFLGRTSLVILISYYLWSHIFATQNTDQMQGYTLPQLLIYYIIANLISKGLIGSNIGFIASEIYQGQLNRYLLYPTSYFFLKMAEYFSHSLFYFIQLLIFLCLFALFGYWTFSPLSLLQITILFLIATFCYFQISTCVELLAFWVDNTWSLMILVRFLFTFLGGLMVPLPFFPQWAQNLIEYLPFSHMIFLPTQALMQGLALSTFLQSCLILISWSLLFSLSAQYLWNKGRYQYSGVGI